MKEPWETLLGQFRHHWMLGEFLDEDGPRIRAILEDERFWSLSSGEQAMVYAAEALLRLGECWLAVDAHNRVRIDLAIRGAIDV
jgi:hypothetical protein